MAANQNTLLGAKHIDEIPYILANLDSKTANKLTKRMPAVPPPVISVIGRPYDVQHRCHMGPQGESPRYRNLIQLTEESGFAIPPVSAIDTAQSSRFYTREQRARQPGEMTRIDEPRHHLMNNNVDSIIQNLESIPRAASSQEFNVAHPLSDGSIMTTGDSMGQNPLNVDPVTGKTVWIIRNNNNENSKPSSQCSMRTISAAANTTTRDMNIITPISKSGVSTPVQMVDQSTQTEFEPTINRDHGHWAAQYISHSTQTELKRRNSNHCQDREAQEERIQRLESEMQALRLQQKASDAQLKELQAHRCTKQGGYIPTIPTPAESTYLSNLREARRVHDMAAEWKLFQFYDY
ncbi:hypothetical protein GLAREA_09577 [Glarea lozoyensis ATCC 20868]|uniref:CRIB domain-containing protein n=1 Tax=Glarea lozoyensis (strain ATCC 20868 / MF5171) TaxID=1116229 RepID=S3D8X6_GLAL2|nr:uncharacterized protein GLAREA_09577 [Glarea lozoyensis ATCC 20868]EPE28456.1 hypothetical protein GLAREA_09577 [Glarea lozoyensis ATCC 20868]